MQFCDLLLTCPVTQSVTVVFSGPDAETITGSADALHDYLNAVVLKSEVDEIEARGNVIMAWVDVNPKED